MRGANRDAKEPTTEKATPKMTTSTLKNTITQTQAMGKTRK